MSLKALIQAIERRKKALEQVMKIDDDGLDVNVPMKIAEEELGKWKETLVALKRTLMSRLENAHYKDEAMEVIGVIQEYEAQSNQVTERWMNYYLNRQQLKGGLLSLNRILLLVKLGTHDALHFLDKKMFLEIKLDLSDLLYNYSVLMDYLISCSI